MKTCVIIYPGSNRDQDMIAALTLITGTPPQTVWHGETALPPADLYVVPGGFSFGDYLRCGAIAARSPISRELKAKAAAGAPVLGVCNGFQILVEMGLLPGALLRNAGLTFVCRQVHLRVETVRSHFTNQFNVGDVLRCPVAHHDGNYVVDGSTFERLKEEDRIAFRYVNAAGVAEPAANPNGSVDAIAGVLSANRRLLGMMPHPENFVEPLHGGTDCRPLFESAMAALVA